MALPKDIEEHPEFDPTLDLDGNIEALGHYARLIQAEPTREYLMRMMVFGWEIMRLKGDMSVPQATVH